jgi:Mg-chelatase subunit ChlD
VLLTDTTPPGFGELDPVQLALHFRRARALRGVDLRIVFVDSPADEGALPSPWKELVRAATPEDGRKIWTGLGAGASLAEVLEQVGAGVLTTVARDIDLRVELSPGATPVIEPGAQDPPEIDPPSGNVPGALRWRLPDLAFRRRGGLSHHRSAVIRNDGAATWTASNQARTSLAYTDPTGRRRAQRFGPSVGPAGMQAIPRPDGPGQVGGGEVSVPSARGKLSVEHRGAPPPPAETTLIIVDTSGSMSTETKVEEGGRRLTRMDVAKRALRALLADRRALPEGRTLGVLKFEGDGASVLWPLQAVRAAALGALQGKLDALVPGRGTPIQASLDLAREQLGPRPAVDPASVLLVTDGEPSDAPPYTATLAAAAALHRAHPGARLHVLGVDQPKGDEVQIGERLAALGGGAYFDVAADVESLLRDLRAAVQPVYEVVDAHGVFFGRGVLTDEPGRKARDFDLPVGTYFVKVPGREPARAVVREGRVTVVELTGR